MINALIQTCALLWALALPADPLVTHARHAMQALNPTPPSPEIADAIVYVVRQRGRIAPLNESQTVDVLLSIAHTEGHFDAWAIGDSGRSVSWGQIYDGPRQLLGDVITTAFVVHEMAAASFAFCPSNPLGLYVRGPKGCRSERGIELGGIKMRIARSIARIR